MMQSFGRAGVADSCRLMACLGKTCPTVLQLAIQINCDCLYKYDIASSTIDFSKSLKPK